MGLKSILAKPFAWWVARGLRKDSRNALQIQHSTLQMLLGKGRFTAFGKDHNLDKVETYEDFKKAVPVRDYEQLSTYFKRVKDGESDVLWPGKPVYLSKTSGTTSGAKYIPITRDSIGHHIIAARNALLMYINETGKSAFADHQMIFLQGSPVLDKVNGILSGRLSGIVYHHVPNYLMRNRMPSYDVNCINDWEQKVEAIAEETRDADMSLISGIPPWVIMYFEKLLEKSDKQTIQQLFPNFKLFVHGGVNYAPYQARIEELVGFPIDTIETYPASEGFIAFQDSRQSDGLLLNTNAGIFYEFIPLDEIGKENPRRIMLDEVELDTNYAIVLTTNAGLWGYLLGDTVRFVSKEPYRIRVSGRVKHYISAFGEHVIAEEVEYAMQQACEATGAIVQEYTVAPQVNPTEGLPYHEWLVEFEQAPADVEAFAQLVDNNLRQKNIYYDDLVKGKVLRPLRLSQVRPGGFHDYQKVSGKLGGQNKVVRLSNDRKVADALQPYLV